MRSKNLQFSLSYKWEKNRWDIYKNSTIIRKKEQYKIQKCFLDFKANTSEIRNVFAQ